MKTWREPIVFWLALTSLFPMSLSQWPAFSVSRYKKIPAPGVAFDNASLDYVSRSRNKCAESCSTRIQCQSYSFQQNTGKCVLYDTLVAVGVILQPATGFQNYWKLTDHCPADDGFTMVGSECVRVMDLALEWHEAQIECQIFGAHLFVGNTADRMKALETAIDALGNRSYEYLVGASLVNGTWYWLSGSALAPAVWKDGVTPSSPTGPYCKTVSNSPNKLTESSENFIGNFVCHVKLA